MLGVTPGRSLGSPSPSSLQQGKDRNAAVELVKGNDQVLGKRWQLPVPGGQTGLPDGKPADVEVPSRRDYEWPGLCRGGARLLAVPCPG